MRIEMSLFVLDGMLSTGSHWDRWEVIQQIELARSFNQRHCLWIILARDLHISNSVWTSTSLAKSNHSRKLKTLVSTFRSHINAHPCLFESCNLPIPTNHPQITAHCDRAAYSPCTRYSTISLCPSQYPTMHQKLQGNEMQHTILPRRFRHTHTREMEPLARTSIIVACDHLTKANLVTVAVPGLLFLVLVVALVERFFIGGDCRLHGGLLSCPLRRGVVASRWPRARLGGFGEVGEKGCGCLGVTAFACRFGLDCICGSIFFALSA